MSEWHVALLVGFERLQLELHDCVGLVLSHVSGRCCGVWSVGEQLLSMSFQYQSRDLDLCEVIIVQK